MRAGSCRQAKVIGCARQSDMLGMQEKTGRQPVG
jgi:hypothetical protein